MIIAWLILFGLALGSFVNALVWRLFQQSNSDGHKKQKIDKKLSITTGRSICPNCKTELKAKDLLPVLSWIYLKGRCRYCSKPISAQYPLVEVLTAVLFVLSYVYWPNPLEGLEIAQFVVWLLALTGLIALFVYDLLWMLLPNRIVFPLYWLAGLFVGLESVQEASFRPILASVIGVLIGGGIFYLIFQLSSGRWIGGGDVKLGFFIGAIVGSGPIAGLVIFLASFLGTLFSLSLIIAGRYKRSMKISFGPFLIAATIISVLFGQKILDWYIYELLYF